MSDADEFVSRNRGIYGFIADEDPNRPVDEWEPFVRDLLAERDRLKDQLADKDEHIDSLRRAFEESGNAALRLKDQLAEADANGLRLAEENERLRRHRGGQCAARIAELETEVERLRKWQHEAVLALDAATVIGTREGAHLNYGNHDRLIREASALEGSAGFVEGFNGLNPGREEARWRAKEGERQ